MHHPTTEELARLAAARARTAEAKKKESEAFRAHIDARMELFAADRDELAAYLAAYPD